MKKLFKTLFWGILIGGIIFVAMPLIKNPTMTIPYPYTFMSDTYKEQEVSSPILILGDQMGKRLYEFAKTLSDELSHGLVSPIQIQSWAQKGDGFHRTLQKLKSLKKIPKVLIFHGLSQEFLELRFLIDQINKIEHNFDVFQYKDAQTALYFLPILSRYFYTSFKRKTFNKSIVPFLQKSEKKRELINIQATTYRVLEHELDEFISLTKKAGTLLIFITTPINYKIRPLKACSASVSDEIKEEINSAEDYIQRGLFKEGLLVLEKDSIKNIPNPFLYFLKAQVNQNLLQYKESLEMYKMAASFDCGLWRANPVLNSILRSKAQENQIYLFDFEKMIDDEFFAGPTFIDETYPQDIYYERLMKALGSEIRRILKLN